ncbi:condensation domain-containing protein [Nocardia sp. MW-W600-9]
MEPDRIARARRLSPAKREILLATLQARGPAPTRADVVSVRGEDEPLVLSFAQQRLWFLDRFAPESSAYVLPYAVRIHGNLDPRALRTALTDVITRHEVLRTTYTDTDGIATQHIHHHYPDTWFDHIDLSHTTETDPWPTATRLAQQQARTGIDLSTPPLLRALLIRLTDYDHLLVLTVHHIASDGWSLSILINELTTLYRAATHNTPNPLTPLPIQYADYAVWQHRHLTGPTATTDLDFWRTELADAPELLELPTDRPRATRTATTTGATIEFTLDHHLHDTITTLSRTTAATPFMTLLTGFAVLLSRYSGQTDICIGTPVANRSRPELENLIGFFVNTLVLRIDLTDQPSFRQLLHRVRDTTLRAFDHQNTPFEHLVEQLRPERSTTHTPLFQVMFILQNTPEPPSPPNT